MNGSAAPTPWDWARGHLRRSTATYWLATVRPNGAPQVRPVLAVWVEGLLHVCMGAGRCAGTCVRTSRPWSAPAAKFEDGKLIERHNESGRDAHAA